MNAKKTLIVYFSHTGQNYLNGKIVDLKKGNTAAVAEIIAKLTGAELFEIKPAHPYPFIYSECTDAAKQELQANARPELLETVDATEYDTIILGYPNWWGTMPMPVFTFLCSQDYSHKTILPFCTNEGSGMGVSEKDLKQICPNSIILPGLAISGSMVTSAGDSIEHWIDKSMN